MSPRRLTALRAFADQDVSPHERDTARALLQAAGAGRGTPPPPPASAAAFPAPDFGWTIGHSGNTATLNVWWRFRPDGA